MQYTTVARGICPITWHIPTQIDIETLLVRVNYKGNSLKAIGQGSGEGAGTNTSGFSALMVNPWGTSDADIWGSTEYSDTFAASIEIFGEYDQSGSAFQEKDNIFSVRCIKDTREPSSYPNPENGAINVSTSPVLRWPHLNPDYGDPNYDVYFGTANPPITPISFHQKDTTLNLTGLYGNTTYYWLVVAIDSSGDSTSSPAWSFTTQPGGGLPCTGDTTILHEGKFYHTVQIGSQCWLMENLNVGLMIQGSDTAKNDGMIEKYCYNNDTMNCNTYGALYDWNEAMAYSTVPGSRGICPSGWHIPSLGEFQTLKTAVSDDGNALKAMGQGTGAGEGTNTSGFSALLTGYRDMNGSFYNLGIYSFTWSSTENNSATAFDMALYNNSSLINLSYSNDKTYGFPVRCVKD
jgi:uncharacterized protein (TIGR02145 family)